MNQVRVTTRYIHARYGNFKPFPFWDYGDFLKVANEAIVKQPLRID